VIGEPGFEAQASRIIVSGYIKFSGERKKEKNDKTHDKKYDKMYDKMSCKMYDKKRQNEQHVF